jgi:hypothetical protein
MRRMLAIFLVGLHFPTLAIGSFDDFPADLEKWIKLDPPKWASSDEWIVANNDTEHEWVVNVREGRPRVRLRKERDETPQPLPFEIMEGTAREGLFGRRLSTRVSDGYLVAFNAGEFGAGLWWFSTDGKKREKLAKAWVNGFIETDRGPLALEGLAHGGATEGRIVRLARGKDDRWHAEDFLDLKAPPEPVYVKETDGSLIIATTRRLLRVVPSDKSVEVLLEEVFWEGLYPNSMVVTPDGTIYLGMRHGVAGVERQGGKCKLTWLLPNREFANKKPKEGFK